MGACTYPTGVNQDTDIRAQRRYCELLTRLTPAQRLRVAASLSSAVRELALAGLRQRHPQADEQELRRRLAVRLYGREVGVRLYGSIPDDAI
jgi:hypothetical protein